MGFELNLATRALRRSNNDWDAVCKASIFVLLVHSARQKQTYSENRYFPLYTDEARAFYYK